MPSIEIVSVGQSVPPVLPPLPFAVRHGPELRSHRSPSPLFESDFAGVVGWMYHLGNPRCDEATGQGPFFAWDLLSSRAQADNDCCLLEFTPVVVPGVRRLLEIGSELSPRRHLLFTTDWQFGPQRPLRVAPLAMREFWALHDTGGLRMNALYPIVDRA